MDIIDFRDKAVQSVGSRSDNLADVALLSEMKGKITQTRDLQHGLDIYTNPKLKAFFDGNISKMLSLFDFSTHKAALEKAMNPFRVKKVFHTLQEALAQELAKETPSRKNRHELMKLLSIRAMEMTKALQAQTKLFPKNAKTYSFDTISSHLQDVA